MKLRDLKPGDICTDDIFTAPFVVIDNNKVVALGGCYSIGGVYVYYRYPTEVFQDSLADQKAREAFKAIDAGRISVRASTDALLALSELRSKR